MIVKSCADAIAEIDAAKAAIEESFSLGIPEQIAMAAAAVAKARGNLAEKIVELKRLLRTSGAQCSDARAATGDEVLALKNLNGAAARLTQSRT